MTTKQTQKMNSNEVSKNVYKTKGSKPSVRTRKVPLKKFKINLKVIKTYS